MKTQLHICYICVWGIGPSHTHSLVGGSVFVSPYGPRLIVSVSFPVVSLISLVPSILLLPLPQDSLSCDWLCFSASVSISC